MTTTLEGTKLEHLVVVPHAGSQWEPVPGDALQVGNVVQVPDSPEGGLLPLMPMYVVRIEAVLDIDGQPGEDGQPVPVLGLGVPVPTRQIVCRSLDGQQGLSLVLPREELRGLSFVRYVPAVDAPAPDDAPRPAMSAQELQFALMEQRSFNGFNGPAVVASLREHADLWRAALMTNDPPFSGAAGLPDLMALRDMQHGHHASSLYILATSADAARALCDMGRAEWHADEADVCAPGPTRRALGSGANEGTLVRVWWD
jgi:hypothetical protein